MLFFHGWSVPTICTANNVKIRRIQNFYKMLGLLKKSRFSKKNSGLFYFFSRSLYPSLGNGQSVDMLVRSSSVYCTANDVKTQNFKISVKC